jgi:HSP20 family protein
MNAEIPLERVSLGGQPLAGLSGDRKEPMTNVQIQRNGGTATKTPSVSKPSYGQESRTWDPWARMRALLSFDPFEEMAPMQVMTASVYYPAFDIKETPDGYSFAADVPGIKESDVEITLTGNRLNVSGKRESEKEETGDCYYTAERTFGSFLRSFTLPEDANLDSLNAQMNNGVLQIGVKKLPSAQPKKIEIGPAVKKS